MNGTTSGSLKIKEDVEEKIPDEKTSVMTKYNYMVLDALKCLIQKQEEREYEMNLKGQWEECARVIDRFLFWIFLFAVIAATIYLLVVLPLTKADPVPGGSWFCLLFKQV